MGNLPAKDRGELMAVLKRWASCFTANNQYLGLTILGKTEITFTNSTPIYNRLYSLSYAEKAIIQKKVHKSCTG